MKLKMLLATTAASLVLSAGMAFAGPEMVSGPGAEPECFAPWSADTKYMKWEAKDGPYKLAVVNGFVGNGWRIQMIKTAKAFAEDPAMKDKISEFKVMIRPLQAVNAVHAAMGAMLTKMQGGSEEAA